MEESVQRRKTKMKMTKGGLWFSIVCLAVASVVAASVTRADDSAKQATVTLQSPEQVPGSVLPAGTYMFRQTGMRSGWAIIQIYNRDGSALVTTILAYPNPKVASNGQNVIVYPANGSSSIPAIEGVVFSGDSTVEQLAYPKSVADQIGVANHIRIPTTGTDDAYPSALPDATSSWSAPVASDSNSAAVMTAQNAPETRQEKLPQTASPLPFIALIGLFAIAGVAILRTARRGSTL
jgi:hypothetical protein